MDYSDPRGIDSSFTGSRIHWVTHVQCKVLSLLDSHKSPSDLYKAAFRWENVAFQMSPEGTEGAAVCHTDKHHRWRMWIRTLLRHVDQKVNHVSFAPVLLGVCLWTPSVFAALVCILGGGVFQEM